ncbi:hypothetical protein N7517_009426 [Penicillium concentricum]|uniref:Uncharacterized protein n=1 Tax=Penicillium concentricum TaxID=293559 RepID=A0A9W9UYV5_9EURO|nr:uncharacterized protein N7517_009426 [Penicillium concentricum]KAJ5360235.1 hypothetical protein N7517_009426 [Penicillium concentricum]
MEEGGIPRTISAKASGNNPVISSSLVTAVPSTLEAKGTPKTHSPRGLYRISSTKNRLEANIRKLVGAPLESQNLRFRGLTFGELDSTLAFFILQRTSNNSLTNLISDSILQMPQVTHLNMFEN